jgi:hypothetical protein
MKYFARINAVANRLERLSTRLRGPEPCRREILDIVADMRRMADESAGLRAASDKIKGFAPGHYFCFCNECGKRFNGAKHSWRCEQCEAPKM